MLFFMAAVDALLEAGEVGLRRLDALAAVCNRQLWCCNRPGLELEPASSEAASAVRRGWDGDHRMTGCCNQIEGCWNRGPAKLQPWPGKLEPRSGGATRRLRAGGGCYNCGRKKLEPWFGGAGSMVRRSCNRSLAELRGDDPSAGYCNRGLRELEPWSGGAARRRPCWLDAGTSTWICWNREDVATTRRRRGRHSRRCWDRPATAFAGTGAPRRRPWRR